jgi:hypothetical protein
VTRRTLSFHKLIHAPLAFVFAWCTDYREDDDRITDDIYHYRARVILRQPHRVVRVVQVPGRVRNRATDVELISLFPPDRWTLRKLSVTDDKFGSYRLRPARRGWTRLDMRFRESWTAARPPSRRRYRALFNVVWDRYVQKIEQEFLRSVVPARARR